ncbi:MAG: hypothetical protein U5N85_12105 [Arcicella sp.]|nr:hypothetical protein [Arcicella sp.]
MGVGVMPFVKILAPRKNRGEAGTQKRIHTAIEEEFQNNTDYDNI